MMIERGCDFAALCNSLLEFISECWLNHGPLSCDGRIHLLGGSGILLVSTLLLGGCDGGICLLLGSTLLLVGCGFAALCSSLLEVRTINTNIGKMKS